MSGGANPTAVPADPNRSIVVVVPFDAPYESNKPFYPKDKHAIWHAQFNHRYGRTNLFDDKTTYQVITEFQDTPPPKDPLLKRVYKTYQIQVVDDYNKWTKAKGDPLGLYNLIVRALDHGMIAEAMNWSKELNELCEKTKPMLPARVAAFLTSYRAIKDDLDRISPMKNDAEEWREIIDTLYAGTVLHHNGKHYSIISWDANPAELTARVSHLEDNFKAFYLWHATQGITLKTPKKQQIVVLLKGANEFSRMRLAFAGRDENLNKVRSLDDDFYAARHDFAGLPPLTDAFLAPHHNILVVSPERIDGVGRSFRMSNRNLYREGLTRQLLLSGGGPPLADPMANPMSPQGPGGPPRGEGGGPALQPPMPKAGPVTKSKEEVAQYQTTAFVERFDEDATELAAVSCEGSRQLLFASEMFPDHVDLPIWLTSGAGDFYVRPRNPVYTPIADNKAKMAIGLTTGYGRANFAMQYRFFAMIGDKEFKLADADMFRKKLAAMFKNVLTDSYFTAASSGRDIDNPNAIAKSGIEEYKRVDALKMKARVLAWAVYYDLIKNQPAEFLAFLGELNRLPRDVAIDRHTHLMLFARAFQLLDDKGNLNEQAFAALAETWYRRIRQVDQAWVEVDVTTPAPTAGSGGGSGPGLTPSGPGVGP